MLAQKRLHTVNSDELKKIQALGFTIGGDAGVPEAVLNKSFPNFNLLQWAESIDAALEPTTSQKLKKEIAIQETPPRLVFLYYSEDYDDATNGLCFCRTFKRAADGIVVKHEFFRLPQSGRGKGVAKDVFRPSIQQYINMDVKRIEVHAALQDGGYVWARNFFTATEKAEVTAILNKAESVLTTPQFRAIKRIYDNYYTKFPEGKAFPMVKWAELPFMKELLRGTDWHGIMDLTNEEQFSNFITYVNKQK